MWNIKKEVGICYRHVKYKKYSFWLAGKRYKIRANNHISIDIFYFFSTIKKCFNIIEHVVFALSSCNIY